MIQLAKFGEWTEITKDKSTLPPENKHVLLKRVSDGSMYVGYWKKDWYHDDKPKWWQPTARTSIQAGMKPSHWMELPE